MTQSAGRRWPPRLLWHSLIDAFRQVAAAAPMRSSTRPSLGDGQVRRRRSSRFANRHRPCPSCAQHPDQRATAPTEHEQAAAVRIDARSVSCTNSARPSKPLRMSARRAASQTRAPLGAGDDRRRWPVASAFISADTAVSMRPTRNSASGRRWGQRRPSAAQ